MKLLVLGAAGMLGHKLMQRLSAAHDIVGALRSRETPPELARVLKGQRIITGVDGTDSAAVARVLDAERPDVVYNCIGVIKQLKEAKNPIISIETNSLLPHRLCQLSAERGARFVHFSTDCVFSGRAGNYTEASETDATDLYGRTKLLGEVDSPGLTIRSSIIGRELRGHVGLIDWFLSQRGGQVKGFSRAIYTGLTTQAMADLMAQLLATAPDLTGLWQVSTAPISKYDLLLLVNDFYKTGTRIDRDEDFFCDRSLDSSRFRARLGWTPPDWPSMVAAMRDDPTLYD